MSLTLYPAIDLKAGQVVRLRQGLMDEATKYGSDPGAVARRWAEAGTEWLHVVDLDGAFAGRAQNEAAIRAIRAGAPSGVKIQVGGGLRSLAAIEACFELGVDRVIIGSAALELQGATFRPSQLLAEAVAKWGSDRVIVSIDAKGGWVATDGWAVTAPVLAVDLAAAVRTIGVTSVLYTDIARDGMMTGPNWEGLAQMGEAMGGSGLIASGGIHAITDLERLQRIRGVSGAIIGRAIYEGAIDLKEALDLCR
ncbi:MAG TPA: 1-(5-phosphoribosyl)-5-[(5-phosphoribosylamino)methylideneamino]imidazole-4-carboxamide isomerase [Symbiobacteriaceae bacterium]|nr:1-(5-phosphoribosyl)-5-[(5-phosphoribosylamino)methylideneamino]imidazole-4-carboxamide isomerase [Symbiobacteriaceae bacterium]